MLVSVAADLTANLTGREFRAVHVDVRLSSADQRDDLGELSGGDAVPGLNLDVRRSEGSGDSSGTRVGWIVHRAGGRRVGRSGIGLGVTQPEDDSSLVLRKSDVDVRLPDIPFEILEGQDVLDFRVVIVDSCAEGSASRCRDDRRRLLEPIEEFVEKRLPWSVNPKALPVTAMTAAAAIATLFITGLPALTSLPEGFRGSAARGRDNTSPGPPDASNKRAKGSV